MEHCDNASVEQQSTARNTLRRATLFAPPARRRQRVQRIAISLLQHVLRPNVFVPAVLGFGLLAFILLVSNPKKIGPLLAHIGFITGVTVFGLTIPFLAARAIVWRQLLSEEGVQVSWRAALMAFAGGEFAKSLPGGVYFEDYLLRSCCNVPFGQSIAATTAVSGLEAIVALPVVMIWGVPGWRWLRLSLGIAICVYIAVLVTLWWLANPQGESARIPVPRLLAPVVSTVRELLLDARPFFSLRTLRDNTAPTALYLLVVSVDLFIIGRTIGIHQLDLREAAVAYCFSVLALILVPIPTDIGVTEASGAGVLYAFGATPSQAVATLLGLRILLTGSTMAITGAILLALWRQFHRPRVVD
jgi:hypothetical protein